MDINIEIKTAADFEKFITAINTPRLKQGYQTADAIVARVRGLLYDLECSTKYAKEENRPINSILECAMRNISNSCLEAAASAPQPVDAFAAYNATR